MPPLPLVPNTMKLVIGGVYHDAKWLNIYHVQYSGTSPSSSDIHNYLSTISGTISTLYADEMSADNELTEYTGVDLNSATGAQATFTTSIFGVRSGDFVPASVAMVASLEINRRYRGGHPRKYLPWGTAGTYATGSTINWDSGFVADCQTKFNGVLATMIGQTEGGTTWATNVNVSYRSGGVVRPTAQVDAIVSAIIRTRICSQRRRLGKVGG